MTQTFLNSRFEQIAKRFQEIDILLVLAQKNSYNSDIYQSLCRSAHVLLVSHFEGLYRDVCRDIIDDINRRTKYEEVKRDIFYTFCDYFISPSEPSKSAHSIRLKLFDTLKGNPSRLRIEPFLAFDNKNPAPDILETILSKFGIKDFFWSIEDSDLDMVFQDMKSKTQILRNKLLAYLKKNTENYPYTVDTSIYNPISKFNEKKGKTLWEDFLNNFLKGRHSIVHGHIIENTMDHTSLASAQIKIEILLYAFIINLCSVSNPLFLLPESIKRS